ncbi:MAG: methyltransferase domain-containing protein [Myxococcota bacterium]
MSDDAGRRPRQPGRSASAAIAEYERFFVDALREAIDRIPRPLTALNVACGSGDATLELYPHLPPGTRLIAVDDQRDAINRFHKTLKSAGRAPIYIRKENLERLPFGDSAFDLVWTSLATYRFPSKRLMLRQMLRVLRSPGQLVVATPTRETVVEMTRIFAPWLADDSEPRAMINDTTLASADEWQSEMSRTGAQDVRLTNTVHPIRIHTPLENHPVFMHHLLPMWLSDDHPEREAILRKLNRALDARFELPLHVAVVSGHK